MKNIPNILSAIRIMLVPIFVLFYFGGFDNARMYAAIVYIIAEATDVADGYIARKYDLVTNLGRILDPLGDKLMTLALLTCLTIRNITPLWALVFYAAKETAMIVGGTLIHQKYKTDMPASNVFGKAASATIFLVGVTLLFFPKIPRKTVEFMIAFAIVMAVLALGTYISVFNALMKERRDKK